MKENTSLRMQSPEKRREKANPVRKDMALSSQLPSADTDNEQIDFCKPGLEGRKDRARDHEEKPLITRLKKI